MIKDQDLNDFRKALETYFEYNPEGPKTLILNYDISRKLLDLLNNLEEFTVDSIIPNRELSYLPENELFTYVKQDLARKITNKLIGDSYVKFLTEDDKVLNSQRTRASIILLKRDTKESIEFPIE